MTERGLYRGEFEYLNSFPLKSFNIKDLFVVQMAMHYKGPPGGVESTAWDVGCGPAPSRLRDGVEQKGRCCLKLSLMLWAPSLAMKEME